MGGCRLRVPIGRRLAVRTRFSFRFCKAERVGLSYSTSTAPATQQKRAGTAAGRGFRPGASALRGDGAGRGSGAELLSSLLPELCLAKHPRLWQFTCFKIQPPSLARAHPARGGRLPQAHGPAVARLARKRALAGRGAAARTAEPAQCAGPGGSGAPGALGRACRGARPGCGVGGWFLPGLLGSVPAP